MLTCSNPFTPPLQGFGLDCGGAKFNNGCNGGWYTTLMRGLNTTYGGVLPASAYPSYSAGGLGYPSPCPAEYGRNVAAMPGTARWDAADQVYTNEAGMMAAVQQGPLAVVRAAAEQAEAGILAVCRLMTPHSGRLTRPLLQQVFRVEAAFFSYASGVYSTDCGCGASCGVPGVNHALVLVRSGPAATHSPKLPDVLEPDLGVPLLPQQNLTG